MNTVNDLCGLRPRVVTDRAEIDRLRWFQTIRYYESGLLSELPDRLPHDPSVPHSTYFGIYDGETIQATARVVHGTSRLPMLDHHRFYPDYADLATGTNASTCEISRLAVGKDMAHYQAIALLGREFLRFGARNPQATSQIASIERPLVRLLNHIFGLPMTIVGPPIDGYGNFHGSCVPILLDVKQVVDAFRRRDSRHWEFFLQDLDVNASITCATSTRRELNPMMASIAG